MNWGRVGVRLVLFVLGLGLVLAASTWAYRGLTVVPKAAFGILGLPFIVLFVIRRPWINGRHPRRPPGRCAHRSRPLPKQRKVVHCEARCDPNDGRDKVGDGASASPAIALGPSEANPPWAPTCTTTDTPLRARFAGANCAASLAIPEWPLDAAVPVSERCPAIGDLIFVTEFVLDALCQP